MLSAKPFPKTLIFQHFSIVFKLLMFGSLMDAGERCKLKILSICKVNMLILAMLNWTYCKAESSIFFNFFVDSDCDSNFRIFFKNNFGIMHWMSFALEVGFWNELNWYNFWILHPMSWALEFGFWEDLNWYLVLDH